MRELIAFLLTDQQPAVVSSRIRATRGASRTNGKMREIRTMLGRALKRVVGVVSPRDNHLSDTCHALFTGGGPRRGADPPPARRGDATRSESALPRGVRTVGVRARNCAGLRPDLQSVLTQWWDDSPFRYKP